jgi:hypothetical protein
VSSPDWKRLYHELIAMPAQERNRHIYALRQPDGTYRPGCAAIKGHLHELTPLEEYDLLDAREHDRAGENRRLHTLLEKGYTYQAVATAAGMSVPALRRRIWYYRHVQLASDHTGASGAD